MAFTVTPLLADISTAETTTGWSTGSLDAAFFKQGSNSIAFYMAKNARGSITYTYSGGLAWTAYTDPHLYYWMNSAVAGVTEPKSTGTTTASGYTVRVTLTNAAYREWHVTGSDTWDGGWSNAFVVDMSHTGTQLYASSGTFSSASTIASVTWYIDLSTSGNIRNVPANHWLDAVRVGDGIQAHNTSAADPAFDFSDIAAVDASTTYQWGVLQPLRTGTTDLGLAGKLVIGDSASTNHVDFQSNDESVSFLDLDGSGAGIVSSTLYSITFEGNSTGTDQDVYLGTKVGTGDTMSGRNGTAIKAGGPSVDYSIDFSDSNLHNVGWYGCTIAGAASGASPTADPTTLFEFAATSFDTCDQIALGGATARNCNFLNSTSLTTSGALSWINGTTDVEYSLFVNNPTAIEMVTLAADVSFSGMEFSANTYDVRYEGATDWDLNWTDASGAPTVNNFGAGTLTPVNTVTLTLTNVVSGSQCAIYADAGGYETEGTEMMNETAVGTTVTEDYAYVSSQPIIIRVRNSSAATRYFPYNAGGTVSGNFTLRIDQTEDTIAE